MTLDPTLLSNLLLVLTGFGGAILAALWIALVIWTYRDIRTLRSSGMRGLCDNCSVSLIHTVSSWNCSRTYS